MPRLELDYRDDDPKPGRAGRWAKWLAFGTALYAMGAVASIVLQVVYLVLVVIILGGLLLAGMGVWRDYATGERVLRVGGGLMAMVLAGGASVLLYRNVGD